MRILSFIFKLLLFILYATIKIFGWFVVTCPPTLHYVMVIFDIRHE